jgi:hypothetical protein
MRTRHSRPLDACMDRFSNSWKNDVGTRLTSNVVATTLVPLAPLAIGPARLKV